jgi:hypothetical protein
MLKFIAIFILLASNNASINTTPINNSSINDTLLNNSSLDDWLNNSSKLNFTTPPDLLLADIKYDDLELAGKIFSEKPMTGDLSLNSINSQAMDSSDYTSYNPELPDGRMEGGCSEPICTEDGICSSVCYD